jgi:alpha-methylacyl-CoA racemase
MNDPGPRQGPLRGVRVLELAGLGPAPFGAMVLADMGAEVLRIDRPGAVPRDAAGSSPELVGRGRRSIALNLKRREGVEVALELLTSCDVLIDPFRPGVAERLGLGPDVALKRRPELVYARMTGWGQRGPLAHAPGHDINYLAVAGALHQVGNAGEPPPVPLNLIADFGGGGMLLAFAVAAALVERAQSGRGQVVDVAMVDGVALLLNSVFKLAGQGDWEDERGANWLQGAAPWYRAYATADDRFVTVGALEPQFYDNLLRRLALDPGEWPQWDQERWPQLSALLERLFASRTLGSWVESLEGSDTCFAPAVSLDEVVSHPQLASRGTYVHHDGFTQPAPAPRFERTPGAIGSTPPWAGQDTVEILAELGIDAGRRAALLQTGAAAQLGLGDQATP